MSDSRTVVIDTDPGLDDALALILALRSPVLDVRAITVVAGNVPLASCTSNALRILEALAADPPPPVYEGCSRPLSVPVARAEHVHGSDGIGGASGRFPVRDLEPRAEHAVDAMLDLSRRFGKDLTVISLGPLTNVATALRKDPDAMGGIGELIVMGGSADGRGNVTRTAEFNFFSDPKAARTIVRSGLPVVVVGLNVTERALLPRARFDAGLAAMTREPLRSFLAAAASPYFDFCRKVRNFDGCAMHDPLAVAVGIRPDLIETDWLACDVVESQGLTRGMMLTDQPNDDPVAPPIRVATSVDTPSFVDLFLETVCTT